MERKYLGAIDVLLADRSRKFAWLLQNPTEVAGRESNEIAPQ